MLCTCKHFTRGTTPSFTFDMGVDLSSVNEIDAIFMQLGTIILTKNKSHFEINGSTVKFTLSEEETRLFSDKYLAECQFRIEYIGGAVIMSEPILEFKVCTTLHEGGL